MDKTAVICNLSEPTKTARKNAKCYAVYFSGGERGLFMIRSRGGRFIKKWESIKRLKNFRLQTVPPEHPLYNEIANADKNRLTNDTHPLCLL